MLSSSLAFGSTRCPGFSKANTVIGLTFVGGHDGGKSLGGLAFGDFLAHVGDHGRHGVFDDGYGFGEVVTGNRCRLRKSPIVNC